eukprot:14794358-Alexandrium_andersonii.AAC.1
MKERIDMMIRAEAMTTASTTKTTNKTTPMAKPTATNINTKMTAKLIFETQANKGHGKQNIK